MILEVYITVTDGNRHFEELESRAGMRKHNTLGDLMPGLFG